MSRIKRWWRAYIVQESPECPAEVRLYSSGRRDYYQREEPKLTLRCLKEVGHHGRHRSGHMEWEVETP